MPPRTITPLPFGAGIDRASGEAATQPGTFRDLRDLVLKEGKAEARRGLKSGVGITMNGSGQPATDLVHLGPFRAGSRGLIVATQLGASAAQAMEVWRTSTTGLNPTFTYAWVPPITPQNPVQAFGVEGYARYFLAHDEAIITRRASTVSISSGYAGSVLQANLDGTGTKDIKFRGISRYLDYGMGWGFGTDADPDRPEILRMSYPGDPLSWDPNHYFVCGPRAEPILYAAAMSDRVLVLKENELYVITGYDRTTFGVRLADPVFGVAGSHLAVVVGDECYFWGKEGPRVSSGGPSVDLGLPLDLDGPSPADLVASGDVAYGWSVHQADDRLIIFGFPDRSNGVTRCYCLSVRDPQNPRWSYLTLRKAIACVGPFFAAVGGAPTGYPDLGTLTASADALTIPWTNVSAVGDETVEVWLKVGAGAYARVQQVTVSGSTQQVILTAGIVPGATHYVALRYRRGTEYTAGYSDPVTGGWTATPLANSTDSIAVTTTVLPPIYPLESGCFEYVQKGKTYVSKTFTWTNAVTPMAGHFTDLLQSATNNPATASVVASIAVKSEVGEYAGWGGLKSPGGDATPWYLWVQHRLATGELSAAVAVLGTPFALVDGCLA